MTLEQEPLLAQTIDFEGLAIALYSTIGVQSAHEGNQEMPIIWVNALWDTGATNTCVSDRLAKEQSLIASNVVKIATGNGIIEVSSYTIHLRFPNGLEFKGLEMPEFKYTHDDCDLILGMDIITQGDFAITNQHGRTRFSFRIPSLHSLDYESGHD